MGRLTEMTQPEKQGRGTGHASSLRSALSHPDESVQADFIARVAAVYGEEQSLTKTANRFGCKLRTLERAMLDFPKLGAAIEAIRNRISATKGNWK